MEQQAQPGIVGDWIQRYKDGIWLICRVIFSAVILSHAVQNALWIPGTNVNGGVIVDIVGSVEIISALLIGFGLMTRVGACAMILTLTIQSIMAHFPINLPVLWTHLDTRLYEGYAPSLTAHLGADTILWFIIASVIAVVGGGKYALDHKIFKTEVI